MFPAAAWLILLVAPGHPWATGDPIQETEEGDALKLGACFPGSAVEAGGLNLGQRWGDPSPTASLLIDLRRVTSAASSFDFRTFDPEGVIFYGDTNPGFDWFVLALRRGKPIMQIHNSLTNITVSGGRRLNDGQWHRITVKNEGHVVMLLLDGEDQLTLSHVSHPIVNRTTPQMRIGVGGLFILPTELLVPLNPAMDGCIRRWDWLNTSQAWQEGASLQDPGAKVCLATVQRGSFFPGDGLAVFQVSGLPVRLSPMDGTWGFSLQLRIRAAPQLSTLLAVWAVEEQRPVLRLALERTDLTAEMGNQTVLLLPLPQGGCLDTPLLLLLTPSSFTLRLGDTEVTKPTPRDDYESLRDVWLSNMGNLVIGGASGTKIKGKTPESPRFQGCLNTVRVQGHELDFDDAQYRSNSIWAHSCPGNVGNKVDVDDGH
ncbi:sex hormone-binding globulin [Protobothrops mucrosquamatus]|uniref:sex hormone-binding globulin n=1 Tax=Protobothrops mucrosquamatus TaxID=103944 RepID=UPI0010FB4A24|nr:sex hormone-binding globulin [Protobothrops mucrosquamatus]